MNGMGKYAQRIAGLLGCEEAAKALYLDYLKHQRRMKCGESAQCAELASIKRFLARDKRYRVWLYGKRTPEGGSTCLELSIAAVMIASQAGVEARLVFKSSYPATWVHYLVSFDDARGRHECEILGKKPAQKDVLRCELGPIAAAMHAKAVDGFAKAVRWRALSNTTHRMCADARRQSSLLPRHRFACGGAPS